MSREGQQDEDDHGEGRAKKGVAPCAVEVTKKMIEQLGYKKVIAWTDNEPAILALKEAARRECHVEMVLEEVLVGDHEANELAENTRRASSG